MATARKLTPLALFDQPYYQVGPFVFGVDEVGRGPLAGPVVAAAAYLPKKTSIAGIDDSKKLSAKARGAIHQKLLATSSLRYHLGWVSAEEIDQLNIYRASQLAMMRAITGLKQLLEADLAIICPDLVLVDAMPLPLLECPVHSIIRGDEQSQLIATASILAKEARDLWMQEQDILYPGYGFGKHMGYPTAFHREALQRLGPCPIHRRSFKPVAACLQGLA